MDVKEDWIGARHKAQGTRHKEGPRYKIEDSRRFKV